MELLMLKINEPPFRLKIYMKANYQVIELWID